MWAPSKDLAMSGSTLVVVVGVGGSGEVPLLSSGKDQGFCLTFYNIQPSAGKDFLVPISAVPRFRSPVLCNR